MDIKSKQYQQHQVFEDLTVYIDFYNSLSFSVMGYISVGTTAMLNIDTYTYSSISGTLESIKDLLQKGRINDAYALLRKYYDSAIINIYTGIYLQDNSSLENFIVSEINDWLKGKKKLPDFSVMSKYIQNSSKLKPITDLLNSDDRYKKLRQRCNDHMHYNLYYNVLLNDNEIHLSDRLKFLTSMQQDLEDIFIMHFAYLFTFNYQYMMASDYVDSLDLGLEPEEGSQYYVASFIQKVFDSVLKKKRLDLATEIKNSTCMQLQ